MKKLLAILLVLTCTVVFLASCASDGNSNNGEKRIPVYQGMTIGSTNETVYGATLTHKLAGTNNGNGNDGDNGNHYGQYKGDYKGKGEDVDKDNPYPENSESENIENEIDSSLKVEGAVHDIYYAKPNEDIYIYIHINNPDSFEIVSFTLNGKKYSSYMFEDGSDMETIILRYNAGNVSGIVEYTIDAIKYIDGTEIKDVIIDGDQTVRAGVKKEEQVSANVSGVDITTSSISLNANITDNDGLVEYFDGTLKAIVYDGMNIVAEKDIALGENNILFDGLKTNTLYQYAIVGYYDDLSGNGFGMNVLYKDVFYTEPVVLFDNIEIWQDSIDFTFLWHEDHFDKSIASLKLYKDGSFVKELDAGATKISGLLSANTYTIVAEYQNGNTNESIYLEFTTFEKGIPGFNFNVENVTQTSVFFDIVEVDSENVGFITKIELIHANGTVVAENVDVREFTNLLSNNKYIAKVTYSYDLNDGTGSKDIVKEITFKTNAKTVPEILVNNPTSTQTSIGFSIVETDPDNVGEVAKIELVHSNGTIVADSVAQRVFTNLISGEDYTVKVTYAYDLNDGEGKQTVVRELSISTVAKTAPVVSITNASSDGNSVLFDIARNDPDGVITKIVASINLGDTKVSERTCENSCYFDELLYSTTYTIKLIIYYDLKDGIGSRTAEVLDTVTTANYTDTRGFTYVMNSDNTAFVKSYVGTNKVLEVPSNVLGYTVTGICEHAFENAEITSIVIPSTVNSIGLAAFNGCNKLESITIPFVGGSKNTNTSSKSTVFGYIFGTSEYVGGVATKQSYQLMASVTYYIPESLKSVTVTGGNIMYGAFSYCSGITSISLGSGINVIGESAFNYSGITNISIAEGVSEIKSAAFANCNNLKSIVLPNSINQIGTSMFVYCRSLEEVVLPENITEIPDSMFHGCRKLAQINIPCSVTSIGSWAFAECELLKSVIVPSTVTNIYDAAFKFCHSLESITLPFIGANDYDFTTNTHFGYIFGDTTYELQEPYTSYIPSTLKEVIITGTTHDYYKSAYWIDDYAFYACSGIERIVVSDNIETIGDCAFQNCSSLKSITLGENVSFIGDEAFEGCWLENVYLKMSEGFWNSINMGTENEPLTSANIFFYLETDPVPELLEGKYWHYVDCVETPWPEYVAPASQGLKYTYKPYDYVITGIGTCKDSVIYIPTNASLHFSIIGKNAFSGCSQITEVVIPKNIKEIRDYAFSDCTNLTIIKYRGTEEEWNKIIKGEGWDANSNFTIIFDYKGE